MNLAHALDQLESAQLVRRAGDAETSYQFKHALTQEAAQASLLLKQRRELHLQVAQTYEELYAERLDEWAAPLAEHYAQAGNEAQALAYFRRAGDAAARVYANAEARQHYARAVELARRREPIDGQEIGYLYGRRGRVLELASQFGPALASYEEMERLARERSLRPLELAAVVAQCQILCTANSEFSPARGEPLAQRALALARELGDRPAESKILWILMNLYRFSDRFPEARRAGEESLQITRELGLREQMAYDLNDLSHVYDSVGEPAKCDETLEEAIRLWRALDNLPMLADGLATFAFKEGHNGNYDHGLACAEEAIRVSESIGNLWGQAYSLSTVGNAYWGRGEADRAIAAMEKTLQLCEPSGYLVPLVLTRVDLAEVLAGLGAYDRALAECRLALAAADAQFPSLRLFVVVAQLHVLTDQGDLAGAAALDATVQDLGGDELLVTLVTFARFALAHAQGAFGRVIEMGPELIERLRQFQMRPDMAQALYLVAQAHQALGNPDAAYDYVVQAQQRAQSINLRRLLWRIDGALADAEAERGRATEASAWRDQAREIVEYIACHAPSDLRATFLNLDAVRAATRADPSPASARLR